MFKKITSILFSILNVALLVACIAEASNLEQTHQAPASFFAELSAGRFDAAAHWYGGIDEILTEYNPKIDPR